MEDVAVFDAGDFLFHGVARGVSVSRVAAKHAATNDEKRTCGLGAGFGCVWVLAYHEHGLSELAVCGFGVDRRDVLWMDVAEDGVDVCVGDRACAGGCALAFSVSDAVRRRSPGLFPGKNWEGPFGVHPGCFLKSAQGVCFVGVVDIWILGVWRLL